MTDLRQLMRQDMEMLHANPALLASRARQQGRHVRRVRRLRTCLPVAAVGLAATLMHVVLGVGPGGPRVVGEATGSPVNTRPAGSLTVEQAFRAAVAVALPGATVTRLPGTTRQVTRPVLSLSTTRGRLSSTVELVARAGPVRADVLSTCRLYHCRTTRVGDGGRVWAFAQAGPPGHWRGVGWEAVRTLPGGVVVVRVEAPVDRADRRLAGTPVISLRQLRALLSLPIWDHLRAP